MTGPGTDRQKRSERKQDEFSVRSSLRGCLSEVCTFASSELSLSFRSVIPLQLRQSARKKRIESHWLSTHSCIPPCFDAKADREVWCSYWTGGAESTVSSRPPELQAGFLHLQHNRNNCSHSAFMPFRFMFRPDSDKQI